MLTVGLIGLTVNIVTYQRQGARWQREDDDAIQVQIHMQDQLTRDNYRTAYVQFFTGREPMRLEKVEILQPAGSEIAEAKPGGIEKARSSSAPSSVILNPTIFQPTESSGAVLVLVHTPQTPQSDQGSLVEIEGTLVELGGAKRTITRKWKTAIPESAPKTPDR
ncbi:hypothetical protein XI06_22315 [Bradyrhizobium sp. CCBAU 11434]|nr:hypothetical protein [Bradyrhizobium sp. CCBAU 11434]